MTKRVCPSVTSESENKMTSEKNTNTINKMERRRYASVGQSHKCDQGWKKGVMPQSRVSTPCENLITAHAVKVRELKTSQLFIREKSSIYFTTSNIRKTDIGYAPVRTSDMQVPR